MATMDINSAQPPKLSTELKLIPRWSVLLAAVAIVGVEYLFWIVIPQHRHHPGPPVGMRVYFAITWGALAALYMLMIGYVSKDAPRRHMSAQIWMVVCGLTGKQFQRASRALIGKRWRWRAGRRSFP